MLEGALAILECGVTEAVTGGTHWVFLAEVDRASARPGAPLAYFRGKFGRLQLAQDESAFTELRSRVLNRDVEIGSPLDLDELAAELGTPRGSAYHALAKLTGEGLVTREPNGAFVVQPLTVEAVEGALRARHAILLGVTQLTVGRVGDVDIEELRRRLQPDQGSRLG